MKTLLVFSVLISFAVMACSQKPSANKAKEDAAVAAAESWLKLVDAGQFDQSWDDAATVFRTAVTKPDWARMLQGVRTPLGKLISRSLKSSHYTTSVPGAPDGEYVVIRFETSFENKKEAVETVTPSLDKGGMWRVSGYFIK